MKKGSYGQKMNDIFKFQSLKTCRSQGRTVRALNKRKKEEERINGELNQLGKDRYRTHEPTSLTGRQPTRLNGLVQVHI